VTYFNVTGERTGDVIAQALADRLKTRGWKDRPWTARVGSSGAVTNLNDADIVISGQVLEWGFEKDGARVGFAPNARLALSNAEALVETAVAGAGVVMLPDMIATRWIASGALRHILQDWQRRDRFPISIVYPQNRHLSAKVRAFTDFVAGLFPRPRAPRPVTPA